MQLESISYAVKKQWILQNVSLQLRAGEIGFLLGRNGSGKTTLLNLISGVWTPLSGQIHSVPSFFYLPASPYLDADLLVSDVYDILKCDTELVTQNEQLLQTQHLKTHTIAQISSGEYKRVWLVATLSHHCQLLLLDEPLSYLDWAFQKKLQDMIIKMSHKGQSFLITTHDFHWTLGFEKAFAWILPSFLNKYPILEALKSQIFQKTFQCFSQIADNPLNKENILLLSPNFDKN